MTTSPVRGSTPEEVWEPVISQPLHAIGIPLVRSFDVAVDVDVDQGLGDTRPPKRLEVEDLLTREMAHEVPVADRRQEPSWQVVAEASEEVDDLMPARLGEPLLEPVAAPPAVGMDAIPDPSQDSLFRRNPW